MDLMQELIQEQYEKQESENQWIDSPYELITRLKNDYSGRIGERLLEELCKMLDLSYIYEDTRNDPSGTFDIKILRERVEGKTARLGKQGSFQHENLRKGGCEKYAFVDVMPDRYYLTVFDSDFDYTKKHPIIGRTPHLRKGSDDVFKFDTSPATIQKCLEAGITCEVRHGNPEGLQKLLAFMKSKFPSR